MPTNNAIDGDEIAAIPDGMDADDILGWVTHYTIGRYFTIDRDWLENKAEEYGVPKSALAGGPTPKKAFKRAAKTFVPRRMTDKTPEGVTFDHNRVSANVVNLDVNDRRQENENLDGHTLCRFAWDADETHPTATLVDVSPGDGEQWFQEATRTFWDAYDELCEANMAKDVSRSIRKWIKSTDGGVKMRDGGAVYFVPRTDGDVLDGWHKIARDIDEEIKEDDHECAVDMVEVIDSEMKRDMVERKARNEIEGLVDSVIDKAVDALDSDTAATAAVNQVADDLMRAENVAVEHNALLDAELSIQEQLEGWKESVKDGSKKQQAIDAAMQEVDV